VSHIAGTTRDAIEDEISIDGVAYRFVDTAGLRTTEDVVESLGIQKTYEKIEQAQLVLHLIEASSVKDIFSEGEEIGAIQKKYPSKKIITIINKADLLSDDEISNLQSQYANLIILSAKEKTGIHELTSALTHLANKGALSNNETIVSNSRHFEALNNALNAIKEVQKGIDNNISADLFAIDIRQALFHLGEITGQVTTEDLLGNIFANFCIGNCTLALANKLNAKKRLAKYFFILYRLPCFYFNYKSFIVNFLIWGFKMQSFIIHCEWDFPVVT
jgi:tRNA modification GTPase